MKWSGGSDSRSEGSSSRGAGRTLRSCPPGSRGGQRGRAADADQQRPDQLERGRARAAVEERSEQEQAAAARAGTATTGQRSTQHKLELQEQQEIRNSRNRTNEAQSTNRNERRTNSGIHPGQDRVVRVLLYCFKPPLPRAAAPPPPRRAVGPRTAQRNGHPDVLSFNLDRPRQIAVFESGDIPPSVTPRGK